MLRWNLSIESDEPEFVGVDISAFRQKHGRLPLMFDPDGDNQALLANLHRLYKAKNSHREAMRLPLLSGPAPVVSLLPFTEQRFLKERVMAGVRTVERARQATRARRSPKYRVAVETAIAEALERLGRDATAKELWALMGTELRCIRSGGAEWGLHKDLNRDVLDVLPPNPTAEPKSIRFKTFQAYVTAAKRRVDAEEVMEWLKSERPELLERAALKLSLRASELRREKDSETYRSESE